MEFNKNKYRIYDRSHFMMVHWMLNPGLAFNELVLGQRVPKVMLEDKTSNKPRYERTFVPCPHCETLHDGRTWSFQNDTAFKNWFGLYCLSCGNSIPCLTNFTSFFILAITFPLWGWFRKTLKERWLAKQPERFKDIDINIVPDPFANNGWIAQGLAFGFVMILLNAIAIPLIAGENITIFSICTATPIWLIGGLVWGYIMKIYLARRGKNSDDFNGFIGRKP